MLVTGQHSAPVTGWTLRILLDTGCHPRAKADRGRVIDEVDALVTERTMT